MAPRGGDPADAGDVPQLEAALAGRHDQGAVRTDRTSGNPESVSQKGGPLSAVPIVLAGGAALMALVGILFFKEHPTFIRMLGITLSLIGLFLLRYSSK